MINTINVDCMCGHSYKADFETNRGGKKVDYTKSTDSKIVIPHLLDHRVIETKDGSTMERINIYTRCPNCQTENIDIK